MVDMTQYMLMTDPDRVIPVDVLRDLEKEGKIGSLHRYLLFNSW